MTTWNVNQRRVVLGAAARRAVPRPPGSVRSSSRRSAGAQHQHGHNAERRRRILEEIMLGSFFSFLSDLGNFEVMRRPGLRQSMNGAGGQVGGDGDQRSSLCGASVVLPGRRAPVGWNFPGRRCGWSGSAWARSPVFAPSGGFLKQVMPSPAQPAQPIFFFLFGEAGGCRCKENGKGGLGQGTTCMQRTGQARTEGTRDRMRRAGSEKQSERERKCEPRSLRTVGLADKRERPG